jgi:iron complex outermembrane receptor protein
MLWAGYARARRTPAPVDRGIDFSTAAFPGRGLPILVTVEGSPNTVSENLDAFEVGYRTQLRANFSLDLATFYNRYGDLTTNEPGNLILELNPPPPHLTMPIVFANQMHGEAHGLEMAVNWRIADRWTLSPGYTFERIHLHTNPASQDVVSVSTGEGSSPHVQAQLRSNLALPQGLEWNTSVYFVGRLPAQDVPSYTRLDTGITWRASERLAVSLVGQNLLRDHHLEAVGQLESSSLIKRSVYAKMTWIF